MSALMRWIVPADAFQSWRDRLRAWYEGHWITVPVEDRRRYMAIYGLFRR